MLTIDGRHGEGGGQILRSSLSLAGITGQALRIEHIRGGRPKPGLMRQHLTAVKAAAQVCSAHVEGAELGSQTLTFTPGAPICGGTYHFAIGSGGGACLVLQTLLPMLLRASVTSSVTVEGGTHNPMAPVFDFIDAVFVPQVQAMGGAVTVRLLRAGFMTAGGGQIEMQVKPVAAPRPLMLLECGAQLGQMATVHQSRVPFHVAEREWAVVQQRLGFTSGELRVCNHPEAVGSGNALTIAQHFEHVTAMATAVGAIGKRAEQVAHIACDDLLAYRAHAAPVCEHLADQLLLPMAVLAGGRYRTGPLSLHTQANIDVLRWFGGNDLVHTQVLDGQVEVVVAPGGW